MAFISAAKMAEIRKVADRYAVTELARLIRADRDAIDRRRKSHHEATALLSAAGGTLALDALLDGMTEFRALATVHVRHMVAEDALHASDAIDGDHDEQSVLISLA